ILFFAQCYMLYLLVNVFVISSLEFFYNNPNNKFWGILLLLVINYAIHEHISSCEEERDQYLLDLHLQEPYLNLLSKPLFKEPFDIDIGLYSFNFFIFFLVIIDLKSQMNYKLEESKFKESTVLVFIGLYVTSLIHGTTIMIKHPSSNVGLLNLEDCVLTNY
ncbi:hypothetical protein ACJX0J_039249, partial [Zea mays]